MSATLFSQCDQDLRLARAASRNTLYNIIFPPPASFRLFCAVPCTLTCQNGGTLQTNAGTFCTCACPPQFTGRQCESAIPSSSPTAPTSATTRVVTTGVPTTPTLKLTPISRGEVTILGYTYIICICPWVVYNYILNRTPRSYSFTEALALHAVRVRIV